MVTPTKARVHLDDREAAAVKEVEQRVDRFLLTYQGGSVSIEASVFRNLSSRQREVLFSHYRDGDKEHPGEGKWEIHLNGDLDSDDAYYVFSEVSYVPPLIA